MIPILSTKPYIAIGATLDVTDENMDRTIRSGVYGSLFTMQACYPAMKEHGGRIINFGSGSARTLVDRVIAGEFPIGLNVFAHHPLISKAKGAPVNTVLHDPVPSTSASMVIAKNAKRPHAALLLVDFILSKEGQEILAKAEYFPARPDTPPLEVSKPVVPAVAGVPENFITPEQLNKYVDSSQTIWQEKFR